MKIMLDPGHNYAVCDTGAVGFGLREQDISFGIAALLKPLLEAAGHEVRLTRETQQTSLGNTENESLEKRCRPANDWGAALFVSLHCNAHTNASACGTEVYSYRSGSEAARYAQRIQKAVTARLGTADRGAKTYGYYVLRHTACPAVLVETAFITNAADNTLLRTRQADFAKAIYEGITGEAYENEGGFTMTQYEELKQAIAELKQPAVYDYVDENMPEWARATVRKLAGKGLLKGDGGALGLSADMLRMLVINDRAGLYD